MTMRPPAATRSIVCCMAATAPVASITTGMPSPPVAASTRSRSPSPPAIGLAPRSAAVASRSSEMSVA